MLDVLMPLFELEQATDAAVTAAAVRWGWALLVPACRLLGLLIASPIFAQRGVSIWWRLVLAFCLALLAAPLLVARGELVVPANAVDCGAGLAGEFLLGALLGFGVLFVFAGLRLAGELIDQQAGTAVGEVFDPHSPANTTGAGQLLVMVGTLALLASSPGGHLRILRAVLDSFALIPVDALWSGAGAAVLISRVGQLSLMLGLQVAAPVLAAGAIVSWGLSTLSGAGGSPFASTLLGLPVRVIVSLGILAACLTGATEVFLVHVELLLVSLTSLGETA